MQRQDYRDITGTDVLPNYDDKTWLIENFKTMIEAASQISRGNNVPIRNRVIKEAAGQIRFYLWGMISKDVKNEKEGAEEAQESLMKLKEGANGDLEEHLLNISRYLYEKGLTAWDARKETDPGRAVLETAT